MQTGFGRMGSHFWGFESQGVVPDIGKSSFYFNDYYFILNCSFVMFLALRLSLHEATYFVSFYDVIHIFCAVTLAKGIGNGFPMGAVVTTPEIASVLGEALHFNTFAGNPLASAVGSAVLDVRKMSIYLGILK